MADRNPDPMPTFDPDEGRRYRPRRRRTGPLDLPEASCAVGYLRVSTAEQAETGLSLDAQADTITAYCQARGWDLCDITDDAGVSGSETPDDRDGLAPLLAALDAGEASVLVVAKLDRLSRDVRDFADLMERAKRHGWAIVAVADGVDTSTSAGQLVAGIMGQVAQWERERISDRTAEALQAKIRRGERLGRPVTLPDDVRRRIAQMSHDGMSLRAIGAALDAEGVPTARGGSRWHASTVRAVLASLEADAEADHYAGVTR